MDANKLDTTNKITVLLQQQQIAVTQMDSIKSEEMSWLKVFLIFYGAVVAWSVSRWFLVPGATQYSKDEADAELFIIYAVLIFSYFATAIFTFLFSQTRKSYYGVRKRLDTIQQMLLLTNDEVYGDGRIFDAVETIDNIIDKETWHRITKPNSSFLTRMVYLFGANTAVLIICYLSILKIGKEQSIWFLVCFLLVNSFIFISARHFDYHHFVKKSNN